jgi:hypothetical protein
MHHDVGSFGQRGFSLDRTTCPCRPSDRDEPHHRITAYEESTGAFKGVFASGDGLSTPYGMTFGPQGNLYVADFDTGSVLRYNGHTGQFIDTFVNLVGNRLFRNSVTRRGMRK